MLTAALEFLSEPSRLWIVSDVLSRPCPVSVPAGIYGWYFRNLPLVPTTGCRLVDGFHLLYVGIAPSLPTSRSTLKKRVRNSHSCGDASKSTLRFSLGCLLESTLDIALRTYNRRLHFGAGEPRLTSWMTENARVAWFPCASPWEIERAVISQLDLPLNLEGNETHVFFGTLQSLRRSARERARAFTVA